MPDLFDEAAGRRLERLAPLAQRLRPQTLDEFVGQEHILGPGKALRRAIEADRVPSLVLYGPPGSGKTTLARIVANTTGAEFEELSAVSATVAQVREVLAHARERLGAAPEPFCREILLERAERARRVAELDQRRRPRVMR